MFKLFVFSLLVTLCLTQDNSCNTTAVTPTCVEFGGDCSATGATCKFGSSCDYLTKKCVQFGTLGQACSTALDCTNVTAGYLGATISCVNGSCTRANYLGVGDACTADHQCPSTSSCNTTCVQPATCYTNDACPFGQKCTVGTGCVNASNVGEDCAADTDCSGLLVCLNKKCVALFSGQNGDDCTLSQHCAGCSGCGSNKTCSPQKDAVWHDSCMNSTDSASCGASDFCACNGSNYQCYTQAVTTQGACEAHFKSLETCYNDNMCTAPTHSYTKFNSIIYAYAYPADDSCEIAHCKKEYDCMLKCLVDASGINELLPFCDKPKYDFACDVPLACQPEPTTSSSSSSTSESSTTGTETSSTSATGTDTTSSSSSSSSSSSATTGTTNTTGSTNSTGSSSSSSSSSSSESTTGFGLTLVAPLLSMIAFLLF